MKIKNLVSLIIVAIVAIVALCSLGRIGEDVKNEEIVINQMPFTGTMKYWTTPGLSGNGLVKLLSISRPNSCGLVQKMTTTVNKVILFR